MRINIEEDLDSKREFGDLLDLIETETVYQSLSRIQKMAVAYGLLVQFFRIAAAAFYEDQTIPETDLAKKGLTIMIQSGFARLQPDGGYQVKQPEKHFGWLKTNRERASKGGQARASAPRNAAGQFLKDETQRVARQDQESGCEESKHPKSPACIQLGLAESSLSQPLPLSPPPPLPLSQNPKKNTCPRSGDDALQHKAVPEFEGRQEVADLISTRKIKQGVQKVWLAAYQNPEWIGQELLKAAAWDEVNSHKRKKDFSRFANNWLAKSWDDYRRTLPSRPVPGAPPPSLSIVKTPEKLELEKWAREAGYLKDDL